MVLQLKLTIGILALFLSFNALGQEGPGGVRGDATNRFWFDVNDLSSTSNDGDAISTWSNKGGNSNDATQGVSSSRPTFENDAASAMNNFPVLRFDGANDFLEIADNSDLNTGAAQAQRSFVLVFRTGGDVATRQVLYEEGNKTRGLNIYINAGAVYVAGWNTPNDGPGAPWAFGSINTPVAANTDYVISFVKAGNVTTTGTINGYLNGTNFGTINNIGLLYAHSGRISIGAKRTGTRYETGQSGGNGQYFAGDIAEFIHYNFSLGDAERIIIENSLAAKYGLSLASNDIYTMDNASNGDFDNDVAGIGAAADGSQNTVAMEEAIVRITGQDPLTAGDYLIWGHNQGGYCNLEDVPAGLSFRLATEWRVSESAETGNLEVAYVVTGIHSGSVANIRLLTDTDNDFSDATVTAPTSTNGDTAFFSGVNLADSEYMTIATSDQFVDPSVTTTRWTGATDSDWFTASNWDAGVPTSTVRAIIPSSATTMPSIGGGGAEVRNIDIESGATLTISGVNELDIYGDFNCNGTFVYNKSVLNFLGTCGVSQINVTAGTAIHSFTINKSPGATISGGRVDLIETLTLTLGQLNTNGELRIISDINNTGRIAEITGGSITGDIEMQRYIAAGETHWRFLCNAVSGADLEQYDDDFVTSGFPGTDWPDWPTAADPWESMWLYDETIGTTLDDGYVAPASTSVIPGVGEGVWVWCGDSLGGTNAFTIDYTGPANTGDIDLPVTFTNTGTPTADGWNMVGNPYPCTIDWDASGWKKTRMANAIQIWNPQTASYATYINGVGANGGSRYIASSQAMWVYATANNPRLTISENCKVDADYAFIKADTEPDPVQVVRIEARDGQYADELVFRFEADATEAYDAHYDALKFSHKEAVTPLFSSFVGGKDYAINTMPKPEGHYSIPLRIVVPEAKQLEIVATDLEAFADASCIILEDVVTGEHTNLFTDTYTFQHDGTGDGLRLVLHVFNAPKVTGAEVACADAAAEVTAEVEGDGPFVFKYTNRSGEVVREVSNETGLDTWSNAPVGAYQLSVATGSDLCPTQLAVVNVDAPAAITINESITEPSCMDCTDGSIALKVEGGVAPYEVTWTDANGGQVSPNDLGQGTYYCFVQDANECAITKSFQIEPATPGADPELRVLIYPNPVASTLQMQLNGAEQSNYTILNITGELVQTGVFTANETVDVSDWASGTYVVRFESNGTILTERLVVRH